MARALAPSHDHVYFYRSVGSVVGVCLCAWILLRGWPGARRARSAEAAVRWFFFPALQLLASDAGESVSDHRHERMTMQTLPGSALEVVETEFFFQLLVRLLARIGLNLI